MKKALLFLLLVLCPSIALAAVNSNAVWELRGNGNDTNGGAFATGVSVKSSKTDLAVSSTNNLNVSSASYGFTSADVGRWIDVTSGTGWTTGFYKITAVTSGVATLSSSPAPVSTTAGSYSIEWGLDYSQQNAKNANGGTNGSSVLAAAAGTTTITCSDCQFTNDIVGNVLYFTGGSGSIAAQRRSVTGYTNSTTIAIDTAIATSTGMTLNIGGALATMDQTLGGNGIVSGNIVWWKNDTGITTGNALTSSLAGGSIYGYYSTRGDLDSSIGSANRPTITYTGTSNYLLTISGGTTRWTLRNFVVNASSGSGASGIDITAGQSTVLYNLTVKNYDSIGINISASAEDICIYCEATGGTVNALEGIKVGNGSAGGSGVVANSYVHDGYGVGILVGSSATVLSSIISNQAGSTSDGIQSAGFSATPSPIVGNTIYSSGRHGINAGSLSTPPLMYDNVLVNNGGYGIVFGTATANNPVFDGNAFYNNTSGTRSGMNSITNAGLAAAPYATVNDVILSGNPFVSAGTGNFALNSTAGAGGALRNAGQPRAWPGASTAGYPDIGAVFHQDPGTVTVHANCGF